MITLIISFHSTWNHIFFFSILDEVVIFFSWGEGGGGGDEVLWSQYPIRTQFVFSFFNKHGFI